MGSAIVAWPIVRQHEQTRIGQVPLAPVTYVLLLFLNPNGSGLKKRGQAACKPGSVPVAAAPGDGHSSRTSVAGRLARPTRTTGPETACPHHRAGPSSLLGLAPGGVC